MRARLFLAQAGLRRCGASAHSKSVDQPADPGPRVRGSKRKRCKKKKMCSQRDDPALPTRRYLLVSAHACRRSNSAHEIRPGEWQDTPPAIFLCGVL
jgi:hypothetical protein